MTVKKMENRFENFKRRIENDLLDLDFGEVKVDGDLTEQRNQNEVYQATRELAAELRSLATRVQGAYDDFVKRETDRVTDQLTQDPEMMRVLLSLAEEKGMDIGGLLYDGDAADETVVETAKEVQLSDKQMDDVAENSASPFGD